MDGRRSGGATPAGAAASPAGARARQVREGAMTVDEGRPGSGKHGVSRRTAITTGLGAIAAPAVLRVIPANAQSRVIKIGHVSPRTGPLAGFGEADPYIIEEINKLLDKGIASGGKTYKVQIISKDSQSNASRARSEERG